MRSRVILAAAAIGILGVVVGVWFVSRGTAPEAGPETATRPEPTHARPVADAAARGTLEGVVLDAESARPIPGAVIGIRCGTFVGDVTSAERGAFVFSAVPDGDCALEARADGYVQAGPAPGAAPLTVAIVGGAAAERVVLRLARAATITGRVESEAGPVAGAALSVLYLAGPDAASDQSDQGAWSLASRVVSDASGAFALTALPPGRVQVLAEHAAYALGESAEFVLRSGGREDGVVIQLAGGGRVTGVVADPRGAPVPDADVRFGDDTTTVLARSDSLGRFVVKSVPAGTTSLVAWALGYAPGTATAIEVAPGETANVTLRLEREPGVLGVVVDPAGRPVAGATVHASADGKVIPRPRAAETDQGGRFWIREVPPSATGLYATHPDHARSETAPIVTAARNLDMVLRLTPGAMLVGRVVDEAGRPVAHFVARVSQGEDAGADRRMLNVADPGGAFEARGLSVGTWRVRVTAPGYPAAESAPVALAAGVTGDVGVIRLERGANVRGRVVRAGTALGIAGARVRLDGMGADGGGPSVATDAEGRFLLAALPAVDRLTLSVAADGFTSKLVSGVAVPRGEERDLGVITLEAAAKGEAPRMHYTGVGAVLRKDGERVFIDNAFEGAPAFEAGLTAHTEILDINGHPASALDLQQVVELIRGEAGTEVTLEVRLPGESDTQTIRLSRRELKTPAKP